MLLYHGSISRGETKIPPSDILAVSEINIDDTCTIKGVPWKSRMVGGATFCGGRSLALDGIVFEGAKFSGLIVRETNSLKLVNCVLRHNSFNALDTLGVSKLEMMNCLIECNGSMGSRWSVVSTASNVYIRNCIFRHNLCGGVLALSTGGINSKARFVDCMWHSNYRQSISASNFAELSMARLGSYLVRNREPHFYLDCIEKPVAKMIYYDHGQPIKENVAPTKTMEIRRYCPHLDYTQGWSPTRSETELPNYWAEYAAKNLPSLNCQNEAEMWDGDRPKRASAGE